MMRPIHCLALAIFYFLPSLALAQDGNNSEQYFNPSIAAEVEGVNSEQSNDLRIQNLSFIITLHGAVAMGELTATFFNQGDEELEGVFEFQLPEGAVVTGYAIDLENPEYQGRLIDGVLLEQEVAKEAYETQVAGQVDPGLANVSRAGLFTTTIYPITTEVPRTLRLRFAFPIDGERGLSLPISTQNKVGSWDIRLEAVGLDRAPDIAILGQEEVTRSGNTYIAQTSGKNGRLSGTIEIAPIEPPQVLISRHSNGKEFVQLSGKLTRANRRKQPENIRIFWDNSRSRKDNNLDREKQLAASLAEKFSASQWDLLIFNSEHALEASVDNAQALTNALDQIAYTGGTSYSLIEGPQNTKADLCLLFSDGIATIDRDAKFAPDCTLHVISSSDEANEAVLSAMARNHGGQFHKLKTAEDNALILSAITNDAPGLQSVRSDNGKFRDFINLPAAQGRWAAIVKSQSDTRLILRLGSSGRRISREVEMTGPTEHHEGAASLWASAQLMQREGDLDRKAYLEFARNYSVEAPSLSFLVLEEPEDYVRHNIDPPTSYPADMAAQFMKYRTRADEEEAQERAKRLAIVQDDWEDVKYWWEDDFSKAISMIENRQSQSSTQANSHTDQLSREVSGRPAPSTPPTVMPEQFFAFAQPLGNIVDAAEAPAEEAAEYEGEREDDSVIIVFASRRESRIKVSIDAWQPDRPYLNALNASPSEFETIFSAQEAEHGSLPIFYLDIANWLNKNGQKDRAVEVLLSALELPIANNETLIIVAQRLLVYGEINRAIELMEYIAATNPARPQPNRSLALALFKRAKEAGNDAAADDYNRALLLLNDIIISPIKDGDEGIDMISLIEANAELPAAIAAGAKNPIDNSLVAHLDTDLRILIEWTTERTDIDLWVIEPSGEKAYFANEQTKIGGRMSNDMTDGFGPEEYLLRNAMRGQYRVLADVYSSDRINPNGASLLTARLIRNFGRPNQSEEIIDVELMGGDDDERKIGEFTVE